MKKPCRVIVCGTGGVGGGALREALRMPWIQVVGVLVYSKSKADVDIGELVGMAPIGVKTTMDFEAILKLKADCVIYCARDIGDDSNDDIFVRLLESGKNVVTALAYHRPQNRNSGATIGARLEAACQKGGVSFHASGINPGFIVERMTLLATGLCSDIKQIKVEEFFNCEQLHESLMGMFGIGMPVSEAKKLTTAMHISNLYLTQAFEYTCEKLGVKVDRIEQEQFFKETPQDIKTIDMLIKKGTVGSTSYRWTVYVNGKPFFVKENTWFMTRSMQPIVAETTENWLITIEARPSVKLFLEANASMQNKTRAYEGDPTPPGYYATAIPMIQMIPIICDAKPGIIYPLPVGAHWTTEFGVSRAA